MKPRTPENPVALALDVPRGNVGEEEEKASSTSASSTGDSEDFFARGNCFSPSPARQRREVEMSEKSKHPTLRMWGKMKYYLDY